MRIYLIRHADPDYQNDTITPSGHQEAQILARYLKNLKISEIYSSPLGRTQATARYTANLLNLPVVTEPWMRELESTWIKDLDHSCATIAPFEIQADQNHIEEQTNLNRYRSEPTFMEETMEQIRCGSDMFMQRQGFFRRAGVYQFTKKNRKAIAVFTHMGVRLVWLSHLLNIPLPFIWSGFFLHPASITTILMDERKPGFAVPRCIGLGDISHLNHAGFHPQPVGMFANIE